MSTSQMPTSRIIALTVWMVASVFYAYQYILRVMPNIMIDDIMHQFNINAAAFGQFSGVYYIGYALLHLPIGMLFDRYGPRRVMSASILLTVIGLMPLIFAEHMAYPIFGRFLIGVGSSAAILGVFKIIRMMFSERMFPRMLSFSVMIGLIGAIYGGAPVSYMCDVLGYQLVIKIFAGVGVALAFLTYMILPNVSSVEQSSVEASIKEVLRNRKVLLTCIFSGLMVGPLEGFADVWSTVFLKGLGFDPTLAASLPSMIFVGMCFGAPVLSYIAEKIGFLLTISIAGIVMAASFCALLIVPLTATIVSISFIAVGVCCAYQILAIYKASTFVREEVAGLATAAANMIIMIFGYAFHTVIGSVVSSMGGASSFHALCSGIAVIPIALGLGAIGFFVLFIEEKTTQSQQSSIMIKE